MPPTPSKRPASTYDAEALNQVAKWILTGATPFDVADMIEKTYPGTDASSLMLATMQEFERAADFDPPVVLGWCFEAARDLYRRMVEAGDYAGALRAVKQIEGMARVQHRDDDNNDGAQEAGPGPVVQR